MTRDSNTVDKLALLENLILISFMTVIMVLIMLTIMMILVVVLTRNFSNANALSRLRWSGRGDEYFALYFGHIFISGLF